VATFHVILDIGDLVFKLNPGPENNKISTIITPRYDLSNLLHRRPSCMSLNGACCLNYIGNNYVNNKCMFQDSYLFPKGVNFNNLRPIERVNMTTKFTYENQFAACLINARSVCNKTLIIKDLVVDYKVDLLGITETWLRSEGCDVITGELCPSGYRFVHTPRLSGTGGGVGLLYKSTISNKTRVNEHSFRSFECIDITFVGRKPLRAITIYRPPESGSSVDAFFEEFSSFLEQTVLCPEDLLIWGDFNFHIDDMTNRMGTRFSNLLALFNLKQHVTVPTHKQGHTLDLVITRTDSENLAVANLTTIERNVFDHYAVLFNMSLRKPSNERKTVVSRRLKNFDCVGFCDMLEGSSLYDDRNATPNLDSLVNNYDVVLRETLDKLAPAKSRTLVVRPDALWYNDDIADQKRKRRRLERKWRSTKLELDRINYLDQCKVVNDMLYKAKEQYYSSMIQENAHDSKLLFRTVDKLLQKNTERLYPTANNDEDLANSFADFFGTKVDKIRQDLICRKEQLGNVNDFEQKTTSSSMGIFSALTDDDILDLLKSSTIKACALDPLPASIMKKCYSRLAPVFKTIINLSLSTGTMPAELKTAMLSPLLKKPNANVEAFENFRPISNLKFLSKLIEKAVYLQLNKYLNDNCLHEPLQSAYKAFHSTETALVTITDDIMLALDKGENVFLVLLDLSAAFDTVNHARLLTRLQNTFGIQGMALQWFQSYLSNRSQFVSINNKNSSVRDLSIGVPQGSVLGPVLYSLYTAPLADVIKSFGLSYHMYADDNQLYFSFKSSDVHSAKIQIENCVNAICRWMDLNELKINHDKTEIMLIHSKYRPPPVFQSLSVGLEHVTASSSAKSLGVIFDEHMSFDDHVSNICKASFFHLRNLSRIRKYLTRESAATVVHALITSKLDYCNSLLYGQPKYQLQRLQFIQNTAARVVCQFSKYEHITPVLRDLHWLPVQYRILFKNLLIVYKSLNGLCPKYLKQKLHFRNYTSRSLRSVTRKLLVEPRSHSKTYGDRAFTNYAPRLWNELPYYIRNSESVVAFKKHLKTYLFKQFVNKESLFF